MTPILFLGAGKMGAAIAFGLVKMGATRASDLLLIDPHPEPDATALARQGAELNPRRDRLVTAKTVVLAVKPQIWREVAESIAPHLAPGALIVSIAAGVRLADLEAVFGSRPVARVMPTTAVAVAKGVASVYAREKAARAAAPSRFVDNTKVSLSSAVSLELMRSARAGVPFNAMMSGVCATVFWRSSPVVASITNSRNSHGAPSDNSFDRNWSSALPFGLVGA